MAAKISSNETWGLIKKSLVCDAKKSEFHPAEDGESGQELSKEVRG